MSGPRDARAARGKFTERERFWAKVEGGDIDSCWIWIARVRPDGYGSFMMDGGRGTRYAHRIAYEWLRGPVPEGLQLDHLCRQRSCVNPWHLEPVTPMVNVHRSTRTRATDTECANGHPWTDETAVFWQGYRKCLACYRDREACRPPRSHRRLEAVA